MQTFDKNTIRTYAHTTTNIDVIRLKWNSREQPTILNEILTCIFALILRKPWNTSRETQWVKDILPEQATKWRLFKQYSIIQHQLKFVISQTGNKRELPTSISQYRNIYDGCVQYLSAYEIAELVEWQWESDIKRKIILYKEDLENPARLDPMMTLTTNDIEGVDHIDEITYETPQETNMDDESEVDKQSIATSELQHEQICETNVEFDYQSESEMDEETLFSLIDHSE